MNATLQPGFVAWIERAMVKPMPAGLVAFNFNLAEAFQKFQAELIGASRYDPGDSDWACDAESVSDPRFFDLPHSVVGTEWQRVQQLVANFATNYIRNAPESSPLRTAIAVTIGFVDGELTQIWPEQ